MRSALLLSAALLLAACRPDDPPLGGKRGADTLAAPADTAVAVTPLRADTLAAVGVAPTLAQAQRGSFDAFLAAFRAAVARRDAAAVRAVLSPTVTSSFGDDATPEAFFRQYPLDDRTSEAWADLDRLLAGPPGTEDSLRVFPAAFAQAPPPDLAADAGAMLVVLTRNAPLRDGDGGLVETARTGTWLRLCEAQEAEGAYCVLLPDGQTAYVDEAAAFAAYDLRLGFRQDDGRWQLVFLVAGD